MLFIVPFLFVFIIIWIILLAVATIQMASTKGDSSPTNVGVVKVSAAGLPRGNENNDSVINNKNPSNVTINITIARGNESMQKSGEKRIPLE